MSARETRPLKWSDQPLQPALAEAAGVDEAAQTAAASAPPLAAWCATVLDSPQPKDALRYLAYALPPQAAVWWGCLCLEHASTGRLRPAEDAALGAAVRWVLCPGEAETGMVREHGEAAGKGTAAGSLAKAAALAGAAPPEGGAPAPRKPQQVARLVAASVLGTARSGGAERAAFTALFLDLALRVGDGQLPWHAAPQLQPAEAVR
ncbi:MAG: hypothetical protein U0836_20985 [Pirellulales bacterium]